jgi:dehydrogenase/reductase SDR family member 12
VTSGGMLVEKLDLSDLNSEKVKHFDGTLVYAQNKRQQVVMTDYFASKADSNKIHFSTMHPGWSDTPGNFIY